MAVTVVTVNLSWSSDLCLLSSNIWLWLCSTLLCWVSLYFSKGAPASKQWLKFVTSGSNSEPWLEQWPARLSSNIWLWLWLYFALSFSTLLSLSFLNFTGSLLQHCDITGKGRRLHTIAYICHQICHQVCRGVRSSKYLQICIHHIWPFSPLKNFGLNFCST